MNQVFSHELDGDIEPLPEGILVTDMEIGEQRSKGGIIIPNDDAKETGIHPRWCRVYKVGSKVDEVKADDWILVDHGRWSRGVKLRLSDGTEKVVRLVDRKDIFGRADEKPEGINF